MLMFKDSILTGHRILVTGGGSGLGREFSEAYAALGAEVHICGRRGSVLETTAAEIVDKTGGQIFTHSVDIRDAGAVDEMINAIWHNSGPLTGLVNNAAGQIMSPTNKLSTRGFDAVAATVFHGTYYTTHSVGRRWIDEGLKGNVISILVTWIWSGSPYVVPSAMSKAGIHTMTKSLAVEWAQYGIRLNAIAPGPFPTDGAWARLHPEAKPGDEEKDAGRVPMGRYGEMHELRNLAVFLMADGCDYLTGQAIAIDGGGHLGNSGNYAHLASRTEEEWSKVKDMAKAASDQDKALRGT